MHSSAAVAGRALIMLACVVGIPAVALWGTSWSDLVKRVQDFHWPAVLGLASASTPTDSHVSSGEALHLSISGPSAKPAAVGDVAPLSQSESPNPLGPMPTNMAALPQAAPGLSPVMPVGFQASGEPGQTAAPLAGDANAAGLSDLGADPFHGIQDRLRQLGATYYLLESWGNDQQTYRFYCKMAVGGSAEFTRCFEATDVDPLQAMIKVLRQVEGRRTGNEDLGAKN
jgi:hypothetical protein